MNALSDLERDDLHHVLTKNTFTREWLDNLLKEINRIVADHHPDEVAEARSRIRETVVLDILDQAGDLEGHHFKEDRRGSSQMRPSLHPIGGRGV